MPTVVDSLIVQLGLDAAEFKRGQREINDAWTKTRENQEKQGKSFESGNKKLLEGFGKVKAEALGFFAALAGARELKEFISQVNTTNVALGNMSAKLGENPQMLSAWGMAIKRIGGDSGEAAASLNNIARAFYNLKFQGKALPDEVYRVFAMAHRPVPTTEDSLDTFLNKTGAALKEIAAHDKTAAYFFGEGMGLSDSMIALMIKYGNAVSKAAAANKDLAPTDEEIKNSQILIDKWEHLRDTTRKIGGDIENWFSPSFTHTLEWVQSVFDKIHGFTSSYSAEDMQKIGRGLGAGQGEAGAVIPKWLGGPGASLGGSEVSKSNPLPVEVVPKSGGQSFWDWLTGGSSPAATAEPSPGGAAGPGGHARAAWSDHGAPPSVRRRGRVASGGALSGDLGARTQKAMSTAMDELRRQGVPEANLRPAASLLVGNAIAESGLNPNAVHDNGTGYGIYGARLDRRDRMLAWLAANGYAKDSLEGQTKYMAHEAMAMPSIAPILKGATPENLGANDYAFTKGFENPRVVGSRQSQVGLAYRTGPLPPAGAALGGHAKDSAQAGAPSNASGPVVFGDSIAAGLKDYGKTQGAAVVGMGSSWITRQIQGFGGDLRGRKIVLSSGASNSHDPDALAGELMALRAKGVDMKNVTILGVGDRQDFAGYNDRLKQLADKAGASFQPITPGKDHVHPESYEKLWKGIPGLSGASPVGPQASLSTLHKLRPVTTSQTSNLTNFHGGINVTVPPGTDGHGIASHIEKALQGYGFAMAGQSGQV